MVPWKIKIKSVDLTWNDPEVELKNGNKIVLMMPYLCRETDISVSSRNCRRAGSRIYPSGILWKAHAHLLPSDG